MSEKKLDSLKQRAKDRKNKSFPLCQNPDCKFHYPPKLNIFPHEMGYCTLGCMTNDYQVRGVQPSYRELLESGFVDQAVQRGSKKMIEVRI